jgi:hypothetical protein
MFGNEEQTAHLQAGWLHDLSVPLLWSELPTQTTVAAACHEAAPSKQPGCFAAPRAGSRFVLREIRQPQVPASFVRAKRMQRHQSTKIALKSFTFVWVGPVMTRSFNVSKKP